ncbi:ABC transporter permease [Saccharopolyspora sp. NPDC047091]|uniref:ABC transporter permease n=1 Tax=Saccharopolyspora sp. NPDC047091 TaxID=3155924 RepID=UPI0033D0DB21
MTDTTSPRSAAPGRRSALAGPASEWTKLRSVRSTWISLGTSLALVVFYSVVLGLSVRSLASAGGAENGATSALDNATVGVLYGGQFALLTLAAMTITSEYATGSILTTLQCQPRRGRMLMAKCAVLAPVLLVWGIVLGLAGTAVATLALGEFADAAGAAEWLTRSVAVGVYLAMAGVLVTGIGAAVRSVAGTLAVSVLVLLILPMGLQATPIPWLAKAAEYMPGPAGMVLMGVAEFDGYAPSIAVAVLAGWAALGWWVGYSVLRLRDA